MDTFFLTSPGTPEPQAMGYTGLQTEKSVRFFTETAHIGLYK